MSESVLRDGGAVKGSKYDRTVLKVRRGGSPPLQNDLEPYELGYCAMNHALYIGQYNDDPIRVNAGWASGASSITDPNGIGTTIGDGATPICLKNGFFSAWTGTVVSGTIEKAQQWANAINLQANLGVSGASPVQGGETDTVSVGVTGVLPIANGGTGASTINGALTNLITGQGLHPSSVTTGENRYLEDNKAGINLSNSDICGANGIWFQDVADSSSEGIHFARGNSYWDTLWAENGVLYFSPNCGMSVTHSNPKTVIHSGGGTINGLLTLKGGSDVSFDSNSSPALVISPPGQGTKIVMDGNEILCQDESTTTKKCLWINGIGVGPTVSGTSAPTDTIVGASSNGIIYFQVVS